MKKIALFFYSVTIGLLFFSGSVYADDYKKNSFENSFVWLTKSYAPELALQPYFSFKSMNAFMVQNGSQYAANLEVLACTEPLNLDVKNIKPTEVTIFWEDTVNTAWEYYIQEADGDGPIGSGVLTTTADLVITQEQSNKSLITDTAYEYFVRAKCANGSLGDWTGPFRFRTSCHSINAPFREGFNTNSVTFNCWRMLDNNKDHVPLESNGWEQSSSSFEGDRGMSFNGVGNSSTHDDYLISPTVKMNGGIYAITYYYKTYHVFGNEFEVLLSVDGNNLEDFKTVLEPKTKRNSVAYVKKVLYVHNIIGDVNIAWHVVGQGSAKVNIDLVSIEEVSCRAPNDEVVVSYLERDQATFTWTDTLNSNWEYYVQPLAAGNAPTGSGSLSNKNTITVTKTSGSASVNLQPLTWYEFYVRSRCGVGETSYWVGPIYFETSCDYAAMPFWEGFNTTSSSFDCWTIVDANSDATSVNRNTWTPDDMQKFEGNQSMSFYSKSDTIKHNDWLISPTFNLDATKVYRLKYHYKTADVTRADFSVLLSNKGKELGDFTQVLVDKKGHIAEEWTMETVIISGVSGNVNLAWHITTENELTDLRVDNVYFEEIVGCPEPINLTVKDPKENSAVVSWNDDFGTSYEYVVQKSGGNIPTTGGILINKKEATITKIYSGTNLEPNTEYEYYVRTVCGNGQYSIWSEPFKFRTTCGFLNLPYWEGFNTNSSNFNCWTIIDENKDAISARGYGIWKTTDYDQYEGNLAMYFEVFDFGEEPQSDDWLISPAMKFEKNKVYRLKYHFQTTVHLDDSDFEVLASNSGIHPRDFKKVIVKNEAYKINQYQQKIVFITDLDGDVNLAWHIKGGGEKIVYIDNVYIEEVVECPEPLALGVKDVTFNQATITWTDDFKASSWEYYVQQSGTGSPINNGTQTTKKENVITNDHTGKILEPNTDYEFYVRTVCGNGDYSIWAGPFQFKTLCGVYTAPFSEGFNTDSKTVICWMNINKRREEVPLGNSWSMTIDAIEGNRALSTILLGIREGGYDDWLISPTISMDGGMYVLKYHYKTNSSTRFNNEFEVLLSTEGTDVSKFTTTILSSKNYRLENYVEEVVFINGVKGDVNIAWHINSKDTERTYLYLDNIEIKKAEGCPEPYYVTIENQAASGFDVEWQQNGGITSWEVIVVNYGDDEKAVPVKSITVTGDSKTTITGLEAGKPYTIYVRANCLDGTSNSNWSTPQHNGTIVGANDDCDGALNIPVNMGDNCEKSVTAAFLGALESDVVEACDGSSADSDIWFEFTASSTNHMLSISDYFSISNDFYPYIDVSVYDQNCDAIDDTALMCFELDEYSRFHQLDDLVVGHKYYIRLITDTPDPDFFFSLCLNTPNFIDVSPLGVEYTVEELVKEVLVVADCDLVSNVTYRTGTSFGNEPNGIGYFERNNSSFAFDNGIILATSSVETAKGPSDQEHIEGMEEWLGDTDLNQVLYANGQFEGNYNASLLEFDFVPVTDTLKFDFIFASNEYGPDYQCDFTDVFAFFLTDLETDEMTNLAVVPGTKDPISVTTIRDAKYEGDHDCGDANKEYFDKLYHNDLSLPHHKNPINYYGMTVPMTAISAVKPGKKYHIKFAIANYSDTGMSSAVFLKGGSFDLGKVDLGSDLLVETGNAICSGESKIINSDVITNGTDIRWYKDGVLIPSANQPSLEVFETGTYKIEVKYLDIDCETTGSVKVEIYPSILEVIKTPTVLPICRTSLNLITLDLTQVEPEMLAKEDSVNYEFIYFETREDAQTANAPVTQPTIYGIDTIGKDVVIYIVVVDVRTGCSEIFEWTLRAIAGAIPEARPDVKVCGSYVFPALEDNQYYYTSAAATGVQYQVGDVIDFPGMYTIFVLQDNGNDGCYEEVSFRLAISQPVKADVFEDVELECQLYDLKELSADNKYYTQGGGQGLELAVGSVISSTQTIYVYAASNDGLCADESSFTITYKDCPIQKGISPNGDGLNDSFDLSQHGVSSLVIYNRYGAEVFSFSGIYTDQWQGQDKNKNLLPDGTYFYVAIAHGKTKTGWVQINK